MPNIFELINNLKDYQNGNISAISIVMYVLQVIAMWKIFEKASVSGWKSLIPIYNYYILCKIAHFNFWIVVFSIVILFIPIIGTLIGLLLLGISILLINYKLSKHFGHGILFALGLIFFSSLFYLILGFGKSKYRK
jgi:hypothetical protein